MRFKWFVSIFTLFIILLAGCAGSPTQIPVSVPDITPTLSPTTSPSSTPQPTLPPVPSQQPFRLTEYNITAQLDYAAQRLNVQYIIDYTNNSTEDISNLVFLIEPLLFPDCFHLQSLTWADRQPVTNSTTNQNQLTIPLPAVLLPSQSIQLYFGYYLNIPNSSSYTARPIPFGYTERQTNLVDWYPFLPPYQAGKGWQANFPGYYGEHNVYDIANFDVKLEIINAPASVIIAASSPSEQNGNIYTYQHLKARNFVWSISPMYEVSEIQVGDTIVRSYSFPFNPTANQQALKDTAAALQLGNELFVPYPRRMLSVVEADFLDGMEYDGLFFLSRGFYNNDVVPPRAYITIISAHETAHQWFYASVGNDQALEPWLDESLATYFERLFYEKVYPDDLSWWWATRINYFEPKGFINLPLYDYTDYSSYRNAVYLNGAVFMEQLRTRMGDDAFFSFLKEYTNTYSNQQATTEDFLNMAQSYVQQDLQPLFDLFLKSESD